MLLILSKCLNETVFIIDITTPNNDFQPNGLTRSRRSHFSHADTTTIDEPQQESFNKLNDTHISYEYDRLIHFSKSPHSWELPRDWLKICELYPNIVRNKVCDVDQSNNNNDYVHANNNITHKAATTIKSNNNSANNHSYRHRGVATSQ